MQTKQKTLALAGAGIAAAAALGITGATLANAAGETAAPSSSVIGGYGQLPGGGEAGAPGTEPGRAGGMRAAGGTLTADAASKAVAAAAAELDGGTVNGVRALSDGSYVVDGTKADGTHVHVLVDKAFAVTATQEGGPGRVGGRGMPDADDDAAEGGTRPGGGSGSTDPNDANGTSTSATSLPTT